MRPKIGVPSAVVGTSLQVMWGLCGGGGGVTVNCCMRRTCWSFTSRGLCTVGQDDVVILLESLPDETLPPPDVFQHIALLYDQASQGIVAFCFNRCGRVALSFETVQERSCRANTISPFIFTLYSNTLVHFVSLGPKSQTLVWDESLRPC